MPRYDATNKKTRVGENPEGEDGHGAIAAAYAQLRIEQTGHVRPDDCASLEAFQAAFAAADEWEALGLIEILNTEHAWLLRFRRLK